MASATRAWVAAAASRVFAFDDTDFGAVFADSFFTGVLAVGIDATASVAGSAFSSAGLGCMATGTIGASAGRFSSAGAQPGPGPLPRATFRPAPTSRPLSRPVPLSTGFSTVAGVAASGVTIGVGLTATGATTGAAGSATGATGRAAVAAGSARVDTVVAGAAAFSDAAAFPDVVAFPDAVFPDAAAFSFCACSAARALRVAEADAAPFAAGSAAFALGATGAGLPGESSMPVGGFIGWVGTGAGFAPGSNPSRELTSSTSFSVSDPAADLSRRPFRIVS